jgi:DNA modification methylase
MHDGYLPVNQVLHGDCVEVLDTFPSGSVDMVFADPPYNLQLKQELWRPNLTRVDPVQDHWDRFSSFEEYDAFTRSWLSSCRRVLKDTGTIWVIGTYHNIFRVGAILQDLDYWVLNDVVWIKTNPMPNFHGVRFTNAHETLIWAQKCRGEKYTFNYHLMKALNDDLQMRSDWYLPTCRGKERIHRNGVKVHATQKPEQLLFRAIQASTLPGDVILDPFFGLGTTGAVAQRLNRRWIGIEKEAQYIPVAIERIQAVKPLPDFEQFVSIYQPKHPRGLQRVAFGVLVERGLLQPGQLLHFKGKPGVQAIVLPDGHIRWGDHEGSIHQVARFIHSGPCNGWEYWYYQNPTTGELAPVDELRQQFRREAAQDGSDS